MIRSRLVAAAVATALTVTACGSGGDDTGEDRTDQGGAPGRTLVTSAPQAGGDEETAATVSPPTEAVEEVGAEVFGIDEEIRFASGGTSATLSSAVLRGERNRYTLEAGAGQSMILGLVSVEDNALFDVYGPDSALLASGATAESIVLPVDGVYTVIISSIRGNTSYDLTVEIPAG